MTERYSPSLVRRILKLDPWRLKKPETKRSDRVHRKSQTAFFTLPPDIVLPGPRPLATSLAAGCRLLVERLDGARLALTLPSMLCKRELEEDPFSGALFVFRNRRGTALKLLCYDGVGYWLVTRRLSQGRIRRWPQDQDAPLHPLQWRSSDKRATEITEHE